MSSRLNKLYKAGRQSWMAGLTFLALLVLVVIQITWILKAANLEEQNFNHRVALSLRQVRHEIGKRAQDCNQMKDFLCGNSCPSVMKQAKIDEIDSIVNASLKLHNIELEYDFFVGDSAAAIDSPNHKQSKCYLQSLNGLIEKDGIRIGMRFPERNQFIKAELRGWFVISILFILFVGLSFYVMLRLFLRERALMLQTTDFINNMVHEFQTPLTNMRLAANLIRKKETSVSDPKIMEYAGVVLAENAKMEANVNEILKLASLKHSAISPVKVDIHQTILQIVQQFKLRANSSGGSIEFEAKATEFVLLGHNEHFSLLISNLIDNALKYSPERPKITVTTRNADNFLVIDIVDNGIGVEKKDVARIFDKYFRVSTGNVHNVKGFGLGLTYVKKITGFYGGSVSVESQPKQGSTFTVKLPLTGKK